MKFPNSTYIQISFSQLVSNSTNTITRVLYIFFPKVSHLISILFQHEEISNKKEIMLMKYIVQEKEVEQHGRLLRR